MLQDSTPVSPPKVVSSPDSEPYKPTPSPYKEEAPVKRSPDPVPYTPTPSPFKEENAVKRSSDEGLWEEAEGEPLIRVKRDPIDLDEPVPEEETGPVEQVLSTPAPVDNLGYMGPVLPGFLRVTVHRYKMDDKDITLNSISRAEDLMDLDIAGKSDPYVVIK